MRSNFDDIYCMKYRLFTKANELRLAKKADKC